MKRLLFTLLSIVLLAGSASAQVNWKKITFTSIDEPTTVTFTTGTNYFELTAIDDGVISIDVKFNPIMLYFSNVTGEQLDQVPLQSDGSTDWRKVFKLEVVKGQTYRLTTSSLTEAFEAQAYYGESEVTVGLTMSSNYTDGQTYSVIDKNLELVFNLPIQVSNVTISYGQKEDGTYSVERPLKTSDYSGTYTTQYFFVVDLNRIIEPMIEEGDIRPGENFKITVNGIQSQGENPQIYGEDGTYSVTLQLDEMPVQLTGIVPADGSTLYTYYPESGEEGLITFTFDAELDPDPMANGGSRNISVTCTYGDPTVGSYTEHKLPYTIEGNTLTADIRGIRFPETISSSRGEDQATSITINLKGLRSVDGRDVRTNYVGGGTTAVLAIYHLEKQDIQFYFDSDPQGGSLQGYNEILLWLSAPLMSFDNITFSWDTNRGPVVRTVNADQIEFTYDQLMGGYIAYVPLTGVLKSVPVTLTLNGGVLMNGDAANMQILFDPATGIDDVTVDGDEVVKVYTIGGTLVKECKQSEAANGLAKGVYIINNKKYVVK